MAKQKKRVLKKIRRLPQNRRARLDLAYDLFKRSATESGRPIWEKTFSDAYEKVAKALSGNLTSQEKKRIGRKEDFSERVIKDRYRNIRPMVYHSLSLDELLNAHPNLDVGFEGTVSDRLLMLIKKVREDPTLSPRAKLDYVNLLKLRSEVDTEFKSGLSRTPKRLQEKTGRRTQDRFNYLVKLLEKGALDPPQQHKTKVLRVSHDYNRNTGGVQKHLQELNTALNQQSGVEIHQVTPFYNGELEGLVTKGKVKKRGRKYFDSVSGVEIHPITIRSRKRTKIMRLNEEGIREQYNDQIEKIFGDVDPDVVHVHNGYYRPHRDLAKKAKQEGKKVVHTWHGGNIARDQLRKIHDETANLADYNFAVCTAGKKAFTYSQDRDSVQVAYGVDLSVFDPNKVNQRNVKKIRSGAGINDDDFVFFFPGRYDSQKNQTNLIRAFSKVSKQDPKAKLLLMGQAYQQSYMDEMNRLVDQYGLNGKVIIEKPVETPQQMRDHYAAADAVIYPSTNEGRGRSLTEALAMGKPVMASGDAGLRDSIETSSGNVGILFNPNSLEEITNSMVSVGNDPVLREDFSRRGRQYALDELSMESYAETYASAYRSLTSSK